MPGTVYIMPRQPVKNEIIHRSDPGTQKGCDMSKFTQQVYDKGQSREEFLLKLHLKIFFY